MYSFHLYRIHQSHWAHAAQSACVCEVVAICENPIHSQHARHFACPLTDCLLRKRSSTVECLLNPPLLLCMVQVFIILQVFVILNKVFLVELWQFYIKYHLRQEMPDVGTEGPCSIFWGLANATKENTSWKSPQAGRQCHFDCALFYSSQLAVCHTGDMF